MINFLQFRYQKDLQRQLPAADGILDGIGHALHVHGTGKKKK